MSVLQVDLLLSPENYFMIKDAFLHKKKNNSSLFSPVLCSIKSHNFRHFKVTRLRIFVWSKKDGIKGKFWSRTGNSWKQISGSRTFTNMKVNFLCNIMTDFLEHMSITLFYAWFNKSLTFCTSYLLHCLHIFWLQFKNCHLYMWLNFRTFFTLA